MTPLRRSNAYSYFILFVRVRGSRFVQTPAPSQAKGTPRPRDPATPATPPLVGLEDDAMSTIVKPVVNVRVGVGCFVTSDLHPGRVLVGERLGSHGANTIALPGGHLEMGEEWATCAAREIKEEANLDLDEASIRFVHVTNDVAIGGNPDKHYITIFMEAKVACSIPPPTFTFYHTSKPLSPPLSLSLSPQGPRLHSLSPIGVSLTPHRTLLRPFLSHAWHTAQVTAESAPLENLEPHKCVGWTWASWTELQAMGSDKIFGPLATLMQQRGAPPYIAGTSEGHDQLESS